MSGPQKAGHVTASIPEDIAWVLLLRKYRTRTLPYRERLLFPLSPQGREASQLPGDALSSA